MEDEVSIMEDVKRLRRDMALFMVRCGTMAKSLKAESGQRSGSSAIGFAAMGKAFEQCSKVFRNYLQAVDREIEELTPGAVAAMEANAAASVSLTASYSFKPEYLEAAKTDDDADLHATDMRLLQRYEQLELLRPTGLSDAEEAERLELFRNTYFYKGGA